MANRRAAIIYNPMSGRPGRRAEEALGMARLLASLGVEAEARETSGPCDATRLAREAIEAGADTVISYGGDGTLNEVLQGMVGSPAALAVWPGGTANVVARDLALPFDKEALAKVIARRKTRKVTLGVAEKSAPGEGRSNGSRAPLACPPDPGQRYFFMFAGIGLDASIARNVNLKLKRRTGEFAYWVTGLMHLATWQAEPFEVEVDGKRYESVFTLLGNGKGYGGGLCMTPGADLTAPWFELFILPRRASNIVYLSDLVACMRGGGAGTNAVIVRGQHVKSSSHSEQWVQADGEIIGTLPMEFRAVPDALEVVVP